MAPWVGRKAFEQKVQNTSILSPSCSQTHCLGTSHHSVSGASWSQKDNILVEHPVLCSVVILRRLNQDVNWWWHRLSDLIPWNGSSIITLPIYWSIGGKWKAYKFICSKSWCKWEKITRRMIKVQTCAGPDCLVQKFHIDYFSACALLPSCPWIIWQNSWKSSLREV